MMLPSVLSRYPVARLLVPLIGGILLGNTVGTRMLAVPSILIAAGAASYFAMWASNRSAAARLAVRPYYIVPIAVLALAVGCLVQMLTYPAPLNLAWVNSQKMVVASIDDIKYKDFSMQLSVTITASSNGTKSTPVDAVAMITTQGCNYLLGSGDLVAFKPNLQPVKNLGNPDEIDYASMLKRQGIYYMQHLPASRLVKYGHTSTFSSWLAEQQNKILHSIFNSRLNEPCQHMVAALILGSKDLVDNDTRWQYSNAGVAHILALSGLHVGILSIIVWWILMPLDYLRLKKLRLAVTIVCIAAFDVFTGLPPSVMRASIMIVFVLVAHILYRKSLPVNALLSSALFILIFDPNALFSVGFQLSFITVLAILLYSTPAKPVGNKAWQAVKSTLATSAIAMASTLVLTAYYFHSISTMSILSNLLILPVFPVFMVLAAFFVIFLALRGEITVLESVVEGLYKYINSVVTTISSLPLSHIDGIYITGIEVILFYAILIFVSLAVKTRQRKIAVTIVVLLAVTVSYKCWINLSTPASGMVIFNSYDSTPFFAFENNCGYLWIGDDSDIDVADFEHQHMAFLAHYNVTHVAAVKGTTRRASFFFKPPYCYMGGKRMVAIGAGKWKKISASRRLAVDYMVLTKQCHARIADLLKIYKPQSIVISGDVYSQEEVRMKHECDSLGIGCTSLRQYGALYWLGNQRHTLPAATQCAVQ